MDLEGIMLSEISQRKTNAVWYQLYVESKKTQQTSEYNKKETHRYREQASGYQWGEAGQGVAEREIQTIMCKISHKAILCSTGNTASIL